MNYFRIRTAKMPLALAFIAFSTFLLILKWLRSEKSEGATETPENMKNQNYSYAGSQPPATANFRCAEFNCKDGTPVPKELWGNVARLMKNLEVLRAELKTPIHINSGYRTAAYNAALNGSARNSQHLLAKAADIIAIGYTAKTLHAKILNLIAAGKMQNGGVGLYGSFVHYDVRPSATRWNG